MVRIPEAQGDQGSLYCLSGIPHIREKCFEEWVDTVIFFVLAIRRKTNLKQAKVSPARPASADFTTADHAGVK